MVSKSESSLVLASTSHQDRVFRRDSGGGAFLVSIQTLNSSGIMPERPEHLPQKLPPDLDPKLLTSAVNVCQRGPIIGKAQSDLPDEDDDFDKKYNILPDKTLDTRKHCVLKPGASKNGEGGIRTRGTGVYPYDGLANRCLQPLGHLSKVRLVYIR
jgi:hypothetical protein